ncbi:MAG: prolyl oligopeptidase family serine peptidase [Byssovorax sp.]
MKATVPVALALSLVACGAEPPVPTAPAPSTSASERPAPVKNDPPPPAHPANGYPESRVTDQKDVIFGVEVKDPYRWLEDAKSPEVVSWMKAQDDFARAALKKLPERDSIAARLRELFYLDSVSAPAHYGTRYFFSRRHATKEKSVVYWKEGKEGKEQVLFDPNEWSKDGSLSLGGYQISWDGKLVAYTVHQNNSDEATMYVMDVRTGKKLERDVIAGAKYAQASWTPASDGFYYTWLPTDPAIPAADRPGYAEVRFHHLGDDPAKDRIVHEKTGNPSEFVGGDVSRDGHFLILGRYHGWSSADLYIRDLRSLTPAQKSASTTSKDFTPLAVGKPSHYSAEAHKDWLYVLTDEGAPRYRIFRVDPKKLDRKDWKEIVPERPDATLDGFRIAGDRLLLTYLKDAASVIEIHELDGKKVRDIPLPGVGSVYGVVGRPDEDEAYFAFESFTVPAEIHKLSMKTGQTSLHAKVSAPIDPSPYLVEQVFFPSKDGTRVSMFIVRRKDLKKDGNNRAMLYGYGGFLVSETPAFTASVYPWLERGGVYAVANLRGGGEYGEEWHKNGMLLKKQNVFDDFIAAGEYLVREGYTRPPRLSIYGGSNGGLLVGAVVSQRPDLYGAAICGVPLLDMVRYHLFGSGKTWISEYGSSEDETQFKALYAYSPYHHIKAGTKYPALLMLSADSDDRVDPLHARKFIAALQAATTGGPALIRIEQNSGHGGADMVKAEVEKGADRYAFALKYTSGDP